MAIVFTSVGAGAITIGGTDATGPFPKYNISTEQILGGDGVVLDVKYNISVSGKILASGDMTSAGARQDSLQSGVLSKLTGLLSNDPTGKLEITPYGGLSSVIQFSDAKLIALDFPEQDDASGGVQYQDVNLTFEAYINTGVGKLGTSEHLASAEETWDISESEGTLTFLNNDLDTTPYKTYTITHTVNATGRRKYTDTPAFDKSAWQQAKEWVKSRLVSDPNQTITTDARGGTMTTFYPVYMGGEGSDEVGIDISLYTAYNHNRVANSSILGDAYSVTETWFMSRSTATHDIEVSLEESTDGDSTVTVNGTINPLNTTSPGSNTEDKLTQAEALLSTCLSQAYNLANALYTSSGPAGGTLSTVERTKSVGKNRITGSITYSISYNDATSSITNAISETISITDDNEDQTNQTIAIIAVIGKSDGPVLQNMGTTTERKRSISVEAVMDKAYRTAKPSTSTGSDVGAIIDSYKPAGAYQQTKNETWNPSRGNYNLSIDWTY